MHGGLKKPRSDFCPALADPGFAPFAFVDRFDGGEEPAAAAFGRFVALVVALAPTSSTALDPAPVRNPCPAMGSLSSGWMDGGHRVSHMSQRRVAAEFMKLHAGHVHRAPPDPPAAPAPSPAAFAPAPAPAPALASAAAPAPAPAPTPAAAVPAPSSPESSGLTVLVGDPAVASIALAAAPAAASPASAVSSHVTFFAGDAATALENIEATLPTFCSTLRLVGWQHSGPSKVALLIAVVTGCHTRSTSPYGRINLLNASPPPPPPSSPSSTPPSPL